MADELNGALTEEEQVDPEIEEEVLDDDGGLTEEGEGDEGAEGAETGASTGETHEGGAEPPKRQSGPDEAAKAARITGEREGAERTRREINEAIAAQKIPDPTNPGKFFETYDDFVRYGRKLRANERKVTPEEIEQEDSDKDYIRRMREREQQGREAARKRTEKMDWLRADAAAFKAAYPDADPVALEKNSAFVKFCGSRLHNEPLGELYGAYVELVGEAKAAGAAKRESKAERSVGSGSGGGGDTLTSSQKAELDRWNRDNPDMKMTAKEFLSM